jgi:hypothetical protein
MVVTIISSFVIAIFIVGLAISRYIRRKRQVNDSSYSITKYWRRQLASTSCENFIPTLPTSQVINENTHIIKNSFSWPDASMAHKQDQEKVEASTTISSSSSINSSIMENLIEPSSLTFSLRWDEITKSLYIRIISARNLFIYKRNQQPLLIDSYVRLELHSTSTENDTQGNYLFPHNKFLLIFFYY